jgi:preprotein translocase subunit YajC
MSLYFAIVTAVAEPSAATGGWQDMLPSFGLMAMLAFAFYFLLIRPQQQRQKEHLARVNGIKRGDTVVMSNGMIGKVVRVEDQEIGVEIAQNVTVKVVKTMIQDVRARGEPAPAAKA